MLALALNVDTELQSRNGERLLPIIPFGNVTYAFNGQRFLIEYLLSSNDAKAHIKIAQYDSNI